jgi:uncharacterized protein YjbI with pentapeptide repeats
VNVLCSYLRMPCALPGDPPDTNADDKLVAEYRERIQEREVRLAAQRLLAHHLRPGDDPDDPVTTFWADIDLDLTGATLVNLNLELCRPREAGFTRTRFIGRALFDGAQFTGSARFDEAPFTGDAWFNKAQFTVALFPEAQFAGRALFREAQFACPVSFYEAQFTDVVPPEVAPFWSPPAEAGEDDETSESKQ